MKKLIILILAALLLAACSGPAPTPLTPSQMATVIARTVAASNKLNVALPQTPIPSASMPANAPKAVPSWPKASPTPHPTATSTLTSTPTSPSPSDCAFPQSSSETLVVTRVLNPGTIEGLLNNRLVQVRLIGVADNEPAQIPVDFSPAAMLHVAGWVTGQELTLVKDASDHDLRNHLPRYVFAGKLFINYELIRAGDARSQPAAPDFACQQTFQQAESEARARQLGLWKPLTLLTDTPTPEPGPTATPTPAQLFPPAGAAGLQLQATFTPLPSLTSFPEPCACPGPDLDCQDFTSRLAAQACFDYCQAKGLGDIFHIDSDQNGRACELLRYPPQSP